MTYHENDNDGRFPDDSRVEVRYPRTRQEEHGDRAAWPWLPGSIVEQCGPDEWRVCVEDRGVAVLRDGRPAPRNTASRNLYYPMCFRDSSEIRLPAPRCLGLLLPPDEDRPVIVDRGYPSWAEVDAEQRERLGDPLSEEGRP